jgi:hypothetical protein
MNEIERRCSLQTTLSASYHVKVSQKPDPGRRRDPEERDICAIRGNCGSEWIAEDADDGPGPSVCMQVAGLQ